MSKHIDNNIKLELLNSPSIDTHMGLKYFNNNATLYIKILNRFVERNDGLNLEELSNDELERTLHTLKGLTSTLGMLPLTALIDKIKNKSDKILINEFTQELSKNIRNIKNII
jgi:chemotaxis protein histidine kinase CheA